MPDSIYDKYPRTYGLYDGGDRSLWPVDEDVNEEPASVTNAEEQEEQTTSTNITGGVGAPEHVRASLERIPSSFHQLPMHSTKVYTRRRRRYSTNSNIIPIHGDVDMHSINSSSSELLPSTESSDASCPTSSPSAAFLKELAMRHTHNHGSSSTRSCGGGSKRRIRNRHRSNSFSKIETELSPTTKQESEKFSTSSSHSSKNTPLQQQQQRMKVPHGCLPYDKKQQNEPSRRRYSSDEIYAKTLQINIPEKISSENEKSEGDANANINVKDAVTTPTSSSVSSSYQYYWNSWWEMLMGEKDNKTETEKDGHSCQSSSQKRLGLSETITTMTKQGAHQNSHQEHHHPNHSSVSVLYNKDRRRGVLIPKRLSI